VIKSIEKTGKLSPQLKHRILCARDLHELDHIVSNGVLMGHRADESVITFRMLRCIFFPIQTRITATGVRTANRAI